MAIKIITFAILVILFIVVEIADWQNKDDDEYDEEE